MKARNDRPRRLLACIGNASRWRVVAALAGGEQCVTELASRIDLSQSCTTRHLQALVREGVVHRTRDGKRVVFGLRLEDPAVNELLAWAIPGVGESGAGTTRTGGSAGRAAGGRARAGASGAVRSRRRRLEGRDEAPGPDPAGRPADAEARPREDVAEIETPDVADAAVDESEQLDVVQDDMEDWLL